MFCLQQGISGVLGQGGMLPDPVSVSMYSRPLSYLLERFYSLPKPLLFQTVKQIPHFKNSFPGIIIN